MNKEEVIKLLCKFDTIIALIGNNDPNIKVFGFWRHNDDHIFGLYLYGLCIDYRYTQLPDEIGSYISIYYVPNYKVCNYFEYQRMRYCGQFVCYLNDIVKPKYKRIYKILKKVVDNLPEFEYNNLTLKQVCDVVEAKYLESNCV